MNPWQQTILDFFRSVLRFAVWFCIVLNGLMIALFSIVFIYNLLVHTWSWCDRVLFPGSW